MAVPLSHCNTLRNAFTEEDLTPMIENLKWEDKEEQTAMADYFHQKSSDVQKRNNALSCECKKHIHDTLKEHCSKSCIPMFSKACDHLICKGF